MVETTPEMLAMARYYAERIGGADTVEDREHILLTAIHDVAGLERLKAARLIEDAIPAGRISYAIIEKLPDALRNGEHYNG